MADTPEQAYLRDSFIKEELEKIEIEGVDVDEVYVSEVVRKAPERGKILELSRLQGYNRLQNPVTIHAPEISPFQASSWKIRRTRWDSNPRPTA